MWTTAVGRAASSLQTAEVSWIKIVISAKVERVVTYFEIGARSPERDKNLKTNAALRLKSVLPHARMHTAQEC